MKTTLSAIGTLLLAALFSASAFASTPQPLPVVDSAPAHGIAQDAKKDAKKKDEKKEAKKDNSKKKEDAELSDEDREALEALGYVE